MMQIEVMHVKNGKYEKELELTSKFGMGAVIGLSTMDSIRNDVYACCCCVYSCGGAVNKEQI